MDLKEQQALLSELIVDLRQKSTSMILLKEAVTQAALGTFATREDVIKLSLQQLSVDSQYLKDISEHLLKMFDENANFSELKETYSTLLEENMLKCKELSEFGLSLLESKLSDKTNLN